MSCESMRELCDGLDTFTVVGRSVGVEALANAVSLTDFPLSYIFTVSVDEELGFAAFPRSARWATTIEFAVPGVPFADCAERYRS